MGYKISDISKKTGLSAYTLCQWRNKNAVLWRFKNVVFRR